MRQQLRKAISVLAFLMAAGAMGAAFPPSAEASLGSRDALETIGIATGIGTVLGFSTIAFYDKPTTHMKNVLIGAGAGLIVGIGVVAYLLTRSPDEDEISPEELLPPENKPRPSEKNQEKTNQSQRGNPQGKRLIASRSLPVSAPELVPAFTSVPVALRGTTPQWAVAMQVLELRF